MKSLLPRLNFVLNHINLSQYIRPKANLSCRSSSLQSTQLVRHPAWEYVSYLSPSNKCALQMFEFLFGTQMFLVLCTKRFHLFWSQVVDDGRRWWWEVMQQGIPYFRIYINDTVPNHGQVIKLWLNVLFIQERQRKMSCIGTSTDKPQSKPHCFIKTLSAFKVSISEFNIVFTFVTS